MQTPAGHYLGRKPDSTDFRDHRYAAVHVPALSVAPPPSASLRSLLPPSYDQGQEGSCGPNSGAALMAYLFPEFRGNFSRNQIYWNVRSMEGDTGVDGGVETRDVLSVLTTTGAVPEALWGYSDATLFRAPPPEVMSAVDGHKLSSYSRLTDADHFMACLGVEKFPFILGFTCFASIDSVELAQTGVMCMPDTTEKIVGGHDVLVVGYDTNFKSSEVFKRSGIHPELVSDTALEIRNSWGPEWGDHGHFWMPMPYAVDTTLANDAWTGRRYDTPQTLLQPGGVYKPRVGAPLALTSTQIAAGDAAAREVLNQIAGWESGFISDDEINQVVTKVGTVIVNTK